MTLVVDASVLAEMLVGSTVGHAALSLIHI